MVLGTGQGGLDAVHAPQAEDLLDEVGLAGEVRAARGSNHLQHAVALRHHGAAEALEQVRHLVIGDGGAAHGAHALGTQGDLRGLDGRGVLVHAAAAHGCAAAALEQGGGDVGNLVAGGSVHLALEADGSLAHEVEVAARAGDVALVEAGALEQDVDRGVVNLGVEAAHDTRQRHRAAAVVGDDGHVARERALLAVERGELLALLGGAHHDVALAVALGKLAQVKGVQWLAREVHHVVGDVHDVVDGSATGGDDTASQPLGAGADLHAANDARHVAAAELGGVDAHVHEVGRARTFLARNGRQLDVRVLVQHGTHLGGHAHVGEAVGAVGRDLAVEHDVARAVVLRERHAHGGVRRQNHDAGVIAAEAKLALGAVHAAGLHAAELALLDLEVAGEHGADHGHDDFVALVEVLGAADDLQRSGVALGVRVLVAHGDLAEPHVVRVGVRLLGDHLADDHVVEVLTHVLDRLDLGSGANEFAVQDLRIIWQVNHRTQPLI